MNLEQMEEAQRANVHPVVLAALTLFNGFRVEAMTPAQWEQVLILLYSVVEDASIRSAEIARDFFDAERERIFPGLPRHDVNLATLSFPMLRKYLEPYRTAMMLPGTHPHEVNRLAMEVGQAVENSGRWTIMRAAESEDPSVRFVDSDEFIVEYTSKEEQAKKRAARAKPGAVQGWARVATGRETCGWCLMLVSRGPVYRTPQSAGARSEMEFENPPSDGYSVEEHMNAWHPGCDCKIVPVFNLDDWSGKDRYTAAENMWKAETKGYSGRDAINAFRRAAEAGKYEEYLADL